jgi:hypothetical protein
MEGRLIAWNWIFANDEIGWKFDKKLNDIVHGAGWIEFADLFQYDMFDHVLRMEYVVEWLAVTHFIV